MKQLSQALYINDCIKVWRIGRTCLNDVGSCFRTCISDQKAFNHDKQHKTAILRNFLHWILKFSPLNICPFLQGSVSFSKEIAPPNLERVAPPPPTWLTFLRSRSVHILYSYDQKSPHFQSNPRQIRKKNSQEFSGEQQGRKCQKLPSGVHQINHRNKTLYRLTNTFWELFEFL